MNEVLNNFYGNKWNGSACSWASFVWHPRLIGNRKKREKGKGSEEWIIKRLNDAGLVQLWNRVVRNLLGRSFFKRWLLGQLFWDAIASTALEVPGNSACVCAWVRATYRISRSFLLFCFFLNKYVLEEQSPECEAWTRRKPESKQRQGKQGKRRQGTPRDDSLPRGSPHGVNSRKRSAIAYQLCGTLVSAVNRRMVKKGKERV